MENYVFNRLKADAAAAIVKARHQEDVKHKGLRGRFREILIADLFRPWLPPTCSCGTGTIICGKTDVRVQGTQDDIIIYDRSLMPPILAGEQGEEGVFLFNSVLARVEVKTTLDAGGIKSFAKTAVELSNTRFVGLPGTKKRPDVYPCLNFLVAFGSDLKTGPDEEFERFKGYFERTAGYRPGRVSLVCVLGKGFWRLGMDESETLFWERLRSDDESEQLLQLVAMMSSSAVNERIKRTGRDPFQTLENGIGLYIAQQFERIANA